MKRKIKRIKGKKKRKLPLALSIVALGALGALGLSAQAYAADNFETICKIPTSPQSAELPCDVKSFDYQFKI